MLAAAVLLAAAVVLVTLHRASAQATSGAHRWHPQDPRHARRRAVVESNSAWLLRTGDPGAQCSSESCPDSTMPWSSPLTGTCYASPAKDYYMPCNGKKAALQAAVAGAGGAAIAVGSPAPLASARPPPVDPHPEPPDAPYTQAYSIGSVVK